MLSSTTLKNVLKSSVLQTEWQAVFRNFRLQCQDWDWLGRERELGFLLSE